MGCGFVKLHGQTDALDHEVCHDDRYYRTRICHELRAPDGGILVDIRPDEPGRRHDSRPDQPEMADRGQSLRLVVRYADDGIFDRFQPDLYSPRHYGSQRSLIYSCRTFADHGLPPGKNAVISRRNPYDRALHRSGIGWFRGHHCGGIQLGNDVPLVRNHRDRVQSRPDSFPEREKRPYGRQTGFGTRTERKSGESGDKGNGNVVRQHFILDHPALLRHFELAGLGD